MLAISKETALWLKLRTQGSPEYFSTTPPTVDWGTNPDRMPTTRGGIWDNDTLALLKGLEDAELAASQRPVGSTPLDAPPNEAPNNPGYEDQTAPSSLVTSEQPEPEAVAAPKQGQGGLGEPGGGPPLPWEGAFPGGGSNSIESLVVSSNGNRYARVPLFSWTMTGGMALDVSLHHNSQGRVTSWYGKNWGLTLDARLQTNFLDGYQGTGTAIVVRWGDGRALPYSWDPATAKYKGPDGIYDVLERTGGDTHYPIYTLTTKHQIKFQFETLPYAAYHNEKELYLTKVIDRSNNSITLTRDNAGRITKITDADSRSCSFGYYASGYLRQVRDTFIDGGSSGQNRIWSLSYSDSNLTQVTYPAVSGQTYSRNFAYATDSSRIVDETDLRGKHWQVWYEATTENSATYRVSYFKEPGVQLGAPFPAGCWSFLYSMGSCGVSDPYGRTATDGYDSGRLHASVDEAGYNETFYWNGIRQMNQYRDKNYNLYNYTLDTKGNVTQEISPTGLHSYYEYNTTNDLTASYGDITPSRWEYTYQNGVPTAVKRLSGSALVSPLVNTVNAKGQVTTATVWDGSQTGVCSVGYTYGVATSVVDPRSKTTSITRNLMNWPKVVTPPYPAGATSVTYDNWGRATTVNPPGGGSSTAVYDAEGNVTASTDENGHTSSVQYNDRGLPISVTNAKNETETYVYDDSGLLTQVTNGRGKTRQYDYNVRGEVYRLQLPGEAAEYWTYDGNGNVTWHRQAWGTADQLEVETTYDAEDRPLQERVDELPKVTYSYSNYGHTTNMVDSTGTTTWVYDGYGSLTSFTSPQGSTTYSNDLLGKRTAMTETGVGTTSYTYDNFGRPTGLTNSLGEVTSWEYDDAGRMNKRTLGNGTYEAITYDTRSRPTAVNLRKPNGASYTNIRTQSYTYDSASNVLSHTLAGVTTNYAYDAIDQLTREYRGPSATPTWERTYGYDANGNRTSRSILGGVTETYVNDDADKLTSVTWTGGSKSYTYDGLGRRKTQVENGVTTTYSWDWDSRLASVSRPGMTTNTATYNGLGARVSKTDSGGSKTFRRDGAGVTAPVLGDGAANYTPGVSERRSGTTRYLHSGLKNADSRTLNDKSVEATRTYDAFGNVDSSTGTWQGPFGYAGGFGYQEDGDTSLKLLGNRYYDASIGRFISRDPVGDGRNWYTYCGNNPITGADPSGAVQIYGIWYRAFGPASHAGLVVIDNAGGATEPMWSFAGAAKPNFYTPGAKLRSGSGPWAAGTQDFENSKDKHGGWRNCDRVLVVDNDEPAAPTIAALSEVDMYLDSEKRDYNLMMCNSNTYCYEMIALAGLEVEFDRATCDRETPWTPGWRKRYDFGPPKPGETGCPKLRPPGAFRGRPGLG